MDEREEVRGMDDLGQCKVNIPDRSTRWPRFYDCTRKGVAVVQDGGRAVVMCNMHMKAHERAEVNRVKEAERYAEERRQERAKYEVLQLLADDRKWTTALERLRGMLCVTAGTVDGPPAAPPAGEV